MSFNMLERVVQKFLDLLIWSVEVVQELIIWCYSKVKQFVIWILSKFGINICKCD